ncbi:4057_t:CDS:2, partial [Cetraspora pellucida]
NIKKKAKAKLYNEMINNFIEDFYHMHNSYSQCQFKSKYNKMLKKYEQCQSYLEKKLYSSHKSWARYSIKKVFTTGVELTQHVKGINGVFKKYLDQGTLLKELVKVIENELNKEAQYSQIRNYYESNLLVSLLSTYNTIFKDINSVLKEYLAPILLSLQKAQIKQSLLYQEMMITINQVEESNNEPSGIIEHIYNKLQIRLYDLLSVILGDSTSLCTCMHIINQEMPCRHQYRILLQFSKAVFHMSFIHLHWLKTELTKTSYIIISQGAKVYTTKLLQYINRMQTANCCMSNIRKIVNKKIKFGTTMSVVKTSIQVAVEKDIMSELTGFLTEFIIKYCRSTRLNIEEIHDFNKEIHNSLSISNSEYYKPRGHPLKHLKFLTEESNV